MFPLHRIIKTFLRTAFVVMAFYMQPIAADCPREGLLSAASTYIKAQTSGKIDGLTLSTTNFTYQENNKVLNIKQGVLSQPLKIDLNRSTADTVACASYTMIISSTGSKPYVLSTQIHHPGNDTSAITLIDTIAATTGSLFFNAAQTLNYIKQENWSPLTGQRANRTELRRIGDAYMDMWTDPKAADSIPWGTQCERVEGSRLTKPCGASLPRGGSAKPNSLRRYVVDETIGSVDVLCEFSALGTMPDSHEIRVEDGLVKYVHTVTV
ncbi:hypothetical protein B0O99DRAFT_525487 [Bisporella sp. PMI_857]|nr:hypothetical protein B0O99DRAFT_525487 [Bisporella sp. PMI_857]